MDDMGLFPQQPRFITDQERLAAKRQADRELQARRRAAEGRLNRANLNLEGATNSLTGAKRKLIDLSVRSLAIESLVADNLLVEVDEQVVGTRKGMEMARQVLTDARAALNKAAGDVDRAGVAYDDAKNAVNAHLLKQRATG